MVIEIKDTRNGRLVRLPIHPVDAVAEMNALSIYRIKNKAWHIELNFAN